MSKKKTKTEYQIFKSFMTKVEPLQEKDNKGKKSNDERLNSELENEL